MKWIHWAILAVLLASPVILVTSYAVEFLAVDSALDSGASYDYVAGKADSSQSHPYIPYSSRHGPLDYRVRSILFGRFIFLGLSGIQTPNQSLQLTARPRRAAVAELFR